VAASAIHASGSRSQRDKCASVSESTRSFFNRAAAIAFTRAGCTITTRASTGATARAKAGQNPQASTTTCDRPGSARNQFCNPTASFTIDRCAINLPLASTAVK
jgi:hypothetical protein